MPTVPGVFRSTRARVAVSARLRAARRAVFLVFALNGMLFGSLAPRIPELKDGLGLSAGVLGVVLIAPAIGSLLAMPAAGAAAARWGSARVTRIAAVAFFVLGVPIGLAGNAVELWFALFGWGMAMGGLDVVMNAQAVTVERRYGRSVLSGFHATFSLGGFLGAALGAAAAMVGLPIAVALGGLGALAIAVVLVTSRSMLPDPEPDPQAGPPKLFALPRGPLLALAAAAFSVLLCEGATADWSAVLVREDLGGGPAVAGAAFACFSATMTIGRLLGDRVLTRFGRRRTITWAAGFAAAGMAAGLAVAQLAGDGSVALAGAVTGFALLGIGISVTFPALLSEAGATAASAAPALAAVSSGGYLGFLVGPTVIGGVAELTSLPAALWTIPVLAASAAVLVGWGRRRARPDPAAS